MNTSAALEMASPNRESVDKLCDFSLLRDIVKNLVTNIAFFARWPGYFLLVIIIFQKISFWSIETWIIKIYRMRIFFLSAAFNFVSPLIGAGVTFKSVLSRPDYYSSLYKKEQNDAEENFRSCLRPFSAHAHRRSRARCANSWHTARSSRAASLAI